MKIAVTFFIMSVVMLIALTGCTEAEAPADVFATPAPTPPGSEVYVTVDPGAEALEWWRRDWYGFWTIARRAEEGVAPYSEGKWDCYVNFDLDPYGKGFMNLWDDDMTVGAVMVEIRDYGGDGNMGVAFSIEGIIFDSYIGQAELTVDPSRSKYSEHIEIQWFGLDSAGDYLECYFSVRPWGVLWDDIPRSERPPDYDWYLEMRDQPMGEIQFHHH